MDIGRRIRELREGRGITQRALARAAGIAPNSLYLIESSRRTPSAATVEKLARGLDVEPGVLFESPLAAAAC